MKKYFIVFLSLIFVVALFKQPEAVAAKGNFKKTLVIRGELVELTELIAPATITVRVKSVKPKKLSGYPASYPKAGARVEIKINSKTKLVREYGGKSDLEEFVIGDRLEVAIVLENEELTANLVKDNSIRRLFFLHKGEVLKLDADKKKIELSNGKNGKKVVVSVMPKTKILNGAEATLSDIEVGNRLGVRGILNKRSKAIEASLVKILQAPLPKQTEKLEQQEMPKPEITQPVIPPASVPLPSQIPQGKISNSAQ